MFCAYKYIKIYTFFVSSYFPYKLINKLVPPPHSLVSYGPLANERGAKIIGEIAMLHGGRSTDGASNASVAASAAEQQVVVPYRAAAFSLLPGTALGGAHEIFVVSDATGERFSLHASCSVRWLASTCPTVRLSVRL